MTPWTVTDSWKSCRDAAWGLDLTQSSGRTRVGCGWLQEREYTTSQHSRALGRGGGGVTQGDQLFPTIFNLVVDTLVKHWFEVVVEGVGGQGRRG